MDVNNVIINQWEKNLKKKMASEEIDEKLFESYYSEVNHLAFFWLVRVKIFDFFPKMYYLSTFHWNQCTDGYHMVTRKHFREENSV